MKRIILTHVLLIILLGCAKESEQQQWSAQGTVRNVWCHPEIMVATCDVMFEHDAGPLQTLNFYGRDVPLFTGLHAKINYHSVGMISGLDYVVRISDR
jgi:hypothetical protein